MSKHTPGPWMAHFEEAYFVTGPDLGRVAMMTNLKGAHGLGGRRSGNESAANARLIAAAPDLLDALEELSLLMDDVRNGEYTPDHLTTQPARAAIAKAKGEV